MFESAAVNASPLIFLSRIARLDLLQLVCEQITVPRPVADEIERFGESDPTVIALANISWLVIDDSKPADPVIGAWDLGAGEESVLQWARSHQNSIAIIDDLAGRRCAEALGVPIIGTLGLILAGKRHGLVSQARVVVDQLRRDGMYLSDQVVNEALKRVGE